MLRHQETSTLKTACFIHARIHDTSPFQGHFASKIHEIHSYHRRNDALLLVVDLYNDVGGIHSLHKSCELPGGRPSNTVKITASNILNELLKPADLSMAYPLWTTETALCRRLSPFGRHAG